MKVLIDNILVEKTDKEVKDLKEKSHTDNTILWIGPNDLEDRKTDIFKTKEIYRC